MIDYFENLMQEEQDEVTDLIRLLYRQTFLLERKYDKRSGRVQYVQEYKACMKHLEFIKNYFKVAGIRLCENVHMGMIYLQDEILWGEKLPRLATIYILILKLIYDEQMAVASSSSQIITTMGALNGKAGGFRVLQSIPSPTEMKRAIALLKKYQIIDPLDVMNELDESTRILIYPSIQAVLLGDDIRALLETFSEEDQDGNDGEKAGIYSFVENMSE